MLLNNNNSSSKSVNNATANPISQTPAWALAYSTVKPSLTISPWTIDIHVQTYHPLLATFLNNSSDIHDSFSSVHPQFIYHLMWKSFMFEYVNNEIVCPSRTRSRTVSRGAIVSKNASRDQYESATAHAWQNLSVWPHLSNKHINSRCTWFTSLGMTSRLANQNVNWQVSTLAFKYTRQLQQSLSAPCVAIALL